ncbi:protein arginine N-methyltransferase 5 isoform X2 [Athalia rosae]|uniref:protein arginine N-methyltransferase 5 isoform X2 n=1 Tax=Athalia rosae TaxID=37344 RepID=UPI00203493E9|nr:protein arginine N-methyltransferase 5 isoform X2 [Athalia rosae]
MNKPDTNHEAATMASEKLVSCGLDFCSVPDLNNCLITATSARYDFICIPLVHPKLKREFNNNDMKKRPGPFTRSDMILCSSDWNNLVVGKLSPYIDVDVTDPISRKNNEETLNQELALAAHLGLPAISFKLTRNINRNINFARMMHNKATTTYTVQIWVQVPMENPAKQANTYRSDRGDDDPVESTWEWWNSFRLVCDFHVKLGVALIVSHDIPSSEEIDRWLGEPVRCLILPTTIFITNKKGYPVLSKAHQMLLKKFSPLRVQLILSGSNRHQDITFYHNYLNHLAMNYQRNGPVERFARGYEDYLQCPLQPLMDNLESQTYEIFEKDPFKYNQYQTAIQQAILSKIPESEKDTKTLVIMVVGAGRGPLVRAALKAAEKAKRKVKVYAVEKNPNAVLTLLALEKEIWGDKVTVVSSDMREWNAPEKADILVSELLGSFGDNELSPECLDGVQHFLQADGISIPSSYTSYVSPVQSSKLYNEVRQCKDKDKHPLAHFETPYVVHLQNKYDIAQPQPLFTFIHPNNEPIIDNNRYEVKKFAVTQNAVLHGFSGYFDAVLYNDITLSIEPNTHSPGMVSWFPIFFPIKEAVLLKAGDQVEVHFWRRCNLKNVWYEWCISKPVPGSIHNPNGRSYTIGL